MKKRLSVFILLLALVCTLVACDEETPEHTHAYGEWKVTTAATCSMKGEEERVCACGESETREIATLPHTYGEWITTTPATCGTNGIRMRVCACGESETREIPATGAHTYGNWEVTTPATCGTKGEEKHTCTNCANFETRELVVTGQHTYGTDNKCTGCWVQLVYTEGLSYKLNEDGNSYTVVGINNDSLQDIIIPPYHQKLPVTAIGERAFEERGNDLAFTDAWKSFGVWIPHTVVEIKDHAFDECWALGSISFAHNSQLASIGRCAFQATGISFLNLPSSLKTICEYAFSGCNVLLSVKIPRALTTIENGAFDDCWKLIEIENNSLLDITIGSSDYGGIAYYAKNIYHPLTGSSNLFVEENGCMFYSDQLVCYLVNYCGDQENIRLPDTFNGRNYTIYSGAFFLSLTLKNIIIPSNVMIVAKDEFVYISGQQNIYFEGDSADWEDAAEDSVFDHELPRATVYYYSGEEPVEPGNYWCYDKNGKPVIW